MGSQDREPQEGPPDVRSAAHGAPNGFPTHVFGGTLVPCWVMRPFYGPVARRLAEGGPIRYHSMAPRGGIGRTDKIVASYAEMLETARSRNQKVRVVGHSLGAVVAWALAHEWTDVVDTVELWCAPLRGTAFARLFQTVSAEARFLLPGSRWLATFDRPLEGPTVRSLYTACDVFVVPSRHSSYVLGERAENHFLCPPALRPTRRKGERIHPGLGDHVLLPRHSGLLNAVA